jgi:hypothetical protein
MLAKKANAHMNLVQLLLCIRVTAGLQSGDVLVVDGLWTLLLMTLNTLPSLAYAGNKNILQLI